MDKIAYRAVSVEDLSPSLIPPHVVHAAGSTDVAFARNSPRAAVRQTLEATAALLARCAETFGFRRFILLSTQSVYGKPWRLPVVEDEPLQPRSLYGAMKASQEHLARASHYEYGLSVAVLRMSAIYGPMERTGALVSNFLNASLRGTEHRIEGEGTQSRDLLYVDDAVRTILAALSKEGADCTTFNVGSGKETTILELADATNRIAADFGRCSARRVFLLGRKAEEGRLPFNIERARDVLCHDPRTGLDDGLRKEARWILDRTPSP